MESRMEEEARQQQEKELQKAREMEKKEDRKEEKTVSAEWCDDEIKLLVKGLKIIPVGTRERFHILK